MQFANTLHTVIIIESFSFRICENLTLSNIMRFTESLTNVVISWNHWMQTTVSVYFKLSSLNYRRLFFLNKECISQDTEVGFYMLVLSLLLFY